MQIDLSDKHALVTGATAGIGLAIAKGLANAGATVTITGRTLESVNKAMQILKNTTSQNSQGIVANAGTASGCQTIIEQLPHVDILINNLGIYKGCEFFEIEDDAWQEMFEINVMSGVRLSRHYAKGMRDNGWGRIQFISSECGLNIPTEMVHYGVSKSAIQGVSRGLAKILTGTGVTVNTILPGPTRTEEMVTMIQSMADEQGILTDAIERQILEDLRPSSILMRFATPEEVANMSVYIASKQASATTGSALKVEGGIVESIV